MWAAYDKQINYKNQPEKLVLKSKKKTRKKKATKKRVSGQASKEKRVILEKKCQEKKIVGSNEEVEKSVQLTKGELAKNSSSYLAGTEESHFEAKFSSCRLSVQQKSDLMGNKGKINPLHFLFDLFCCMLILDQVMADTFTMQSKIGLKSRNWSW